MSGEPQLTRFDPRLVSRICTNAEFVTDEVDNTTVARDYDFTRPFFAQWGELLQRVILPPLNRMNCENSEYANAAGDLNHCYLCFSAFRSRDCLYCLSIDRCSDCLSCVSCRHSELCTRSTDLTQCYSVHESALCRNSFELFGCYDCSSCRSCFGCVGLERAEFCIFNQQVAKAEYERFIQSLDLTSGSGWAAQVAACDAFRIKQRYVARTIVDCYNASESRSCGYLWSGERSQYCYRGIASAAETNYEGGFFTTQVSAYCNNVFGGSGLTYSYYLYGCSDCFGSIGLRNKSYCVLNKQYSRDEYFDLVPRIVAQMGATGEWGRWFPLSFSPHDYRDSSVHEHLLPIPLEVARSRGYRFVDSPGDVEGAEAGDGRVPPDKLSAANAAEVLSTTYRCPSTGKAFRYQKAEIDFSMRNGIPLSAEHWRERIQRLIARRTLIPALL